MSGGALRGNVNGAIGNEINFIGGTTSTILAAPGTTLTLANMGDIGTPGANVQFGSATDTGTIQVAGAGAMNSNSNIAFNGGVVRALDGGLGFITEFAGNPTQGGT